MYAVLSYDTYNSAVPSTSNETARQPSLVDGCPLHMVTVAVSSDYHHHYHVARPVDVAISTSDLYVCRFCARR